MLWMEEALFLPPHSSRPSPRELVESGEEAGEGVGEVEGLTEGDEGNRSFMEYFWRPIRWFLVSGVGCCCGRF